ncbi:MAG: hypothetical protein ACLGH0_11890 [Thermoanaerobaculia bacterium]
MKALIGLLLLAWTAAAQPVERELARLDAVQKATEAAEMPEMLRGEVAPARDVLTAAQKAEGVERLYRLRNAFVFVETLAFVREHRNAVDSLDILTELWKTNVPKASVSPRNSLLEAALLQSAVNRSEKLYRASLPYGKASSPIGGLYYLAESLANARFAAFVASLPQSAEREAVPETKVLRSALEVLEAETLRLLAKDVTSQEMIRPSVKLKEARELLDAGRDAGAALLLVEARVALKLEPDANATGALMPIDTALRRPR